MIQLFGLVFRLTGEIDAQLAEYVFIYLGQDDGGVGLTAPELGKLIHSQLGSGIGGCADGKGDEDFIGVQTGIVVAQVADFEVLDRVQ